MKPGKQQLGLRRLRLNPAIRELTREVRVAAEQFIQPHFVVAGISEREPVPGMPNVYRETPASLLQQIESDLKAGVSKIILFGVPSEKATIILTLASRPDRSPQLSRSLASASGSPWTYVYAQQRHMASAGS
jgi:delta-aminolevulinic acid dehydratase/porphobilinogen synthase